MGERFGERVRRRGRRRTCMSRTSPLSATCAWWTLYSKCRDCETRNSSDRMSLGLELGIRAANWSIEVAKFSVLVARKTQVSLFAGARASVLRFSELMSGRT